MMDQITWTDEEGVTGVVRLFRDLSARPHGSKNEQAESDWLKAKLTELGGSVTQDPIGNLLAVFPATAGREQAPDLCIQGHMDMVCAVLPGSGYDPETDPIQVEVHEGVLTSDGRSSLGADNNLGNAAVLFLLEQGIPHGPLRVLFTVQEEIGLEGAKVVPDEWLKGADHLLNTDSFQSDKVIVSSASGVRETWRKGLTRHPAALPQLVWLSLAGFPGGHSGYDIGKQRPNPILWMGELLSALGERVELAQFSGGITHNAIPTFATAAVWCRCVEEVNAAVLDWAMTHQNSDWPEEATLTLQAEEEREDHPTQTYSDRLAWSRKDRQQVEETLREFFNGVDGWYEEFPGVVLSSSNLGSAEQTEEAFFLRSFIRSGDPERERALAESHRKTAEKAGFTRRASGYPSWPVARENPLEEALQRSAVAVTGQRLQVDAVHVGLEPSVLLAKNPGMTAVNYGPDIFDAHSVRERASLETLPKFLKILACTISSFGESRQRELP